MNSLECNKEFKVKIEHIKCTRYKTFQPELPTKKFLFSNEIQNVHKLMLLSEDSSDQNKATNTRQDKKIQHERKQDKIKQLKIIRGKPESKEQEPEEQDKIKQVKIIPGKPESNEQEPEEQDLEKQDKIKQVEIIILTAFPRIRGKPESNEQEPEEQDLEKQEPEEEEPEKKETEEKILEPKTGVFRDKIRRIDLVLVVKDVVQKPIIDMKNEFLSCIVRAGLQVEVEPGVMDMHKNLVFIKIHAPNSVLERYGKYFGTKRYFADTRYDYMNCTNNYEKEWLRFVRKNHETPYGYSNYERSIIVYKILLHLSFVDNANFYGIERLLNKKIFLDVFALHDGPYFITPDQTISKSNARQILNYYWAMIPNIFTPQPIHLIHEYFGPRLAFYFAFYEFFTIALIVPSFLGILSTILGLINLNDWEKHLQEELCTRRDIICSQFSDYDNARPILDYCLSVKMLLILDYIYIPLYSFFIVVGSFMFVRLWQRREYFLKWIWEVGRHDSYYKNAVRPLFDIVSGPRTEPFVLEPKYRESVIPIFFRNVITKIIIILYWYSLVPVMLGVNDVYKAFYRAMIKKYEKPKQYMDYIIMSVFQTFYILLMTVFEKIYHHIVYFIAKCENHSSDKNFYQSIIKKKIGFKMVCQYAFIAYYAWLFGRHVGWRHCIIKSVPTLYENYLNIINYLYGYTHSKICENEMTFCFPFTCIIEVGTLLATLLVVTQVVYKMFDYILYLRTDYNQRTHKRSNIPCWEREYRLSSWTEEDMVRKYINIAAQFTLATWFVIAFPFGPLILFVMNVWHIRHEARKLLLASRRPLLIKTPGTQMNNVLYFIVFIAQITNAINISCVTRTGYRYMCEKRNFKGKQVFHEYHYYYRDYQCLAPDIFDWIGKTPEEETIFGGFLFYKTKYFWMFKTQDRYFMYADYVNLIMYRYCICIIFVLATSCLFLIVFYAIPDHSQEVKKARVFEEVMRNLYHNYEHKQSKYESIL